MNDIDVYILQFIVNEMNLTSCYNSMKTCKKLYLLCKPTVDNKLKDTRNEWYKEKLFIHITNQFGIFTTLNSTILGNISLRISISLLDQ
jgi:hypothetical protein